MIATTVLVTLLLAPAAADAAAPPAACEVFTRGSAAPAPLVHEWFAHSADERVLVCPQPAAPGGAPATPLYFGEGAVTQQGTVCTYLSHGLMLVGSGAAARLQRYDRSEALAMALADGECPGPHAVPGAPGYVLTYDITRSAFVGIMHLWSVLLGAPAGTASSAAGVRSANAATRARVQAALGAHAGATSLTRIVRIPGSLLRHRFALFVKAADPHEGTSARQYVLYVDKSVRGPYQITAFAETN